MSSPAAASPPSPAAAAAEALAQKEGMAVILWAVGMFCILGWDWLTSLEIEIERIWKRKFTVSVACTDDICRWLILNNDSVCDMAVSSYSLLWTGQEFGQYRIAYQADHGYHIRCPVRKCVFTTNLPYLRLTHLTSP